MLLLNLCSLDEGIKKHGPEALKSMKIKLQGFQNPFQKQLKSDAASEEAFELHFFAKICDFLMNLGFQNEPKSEEKKSKMRCSKTIPFWINFYWNFFRFGLRKWKEHLLFLGSFSKKLILLKSLFFQKKIVIFLVLSLQNWSKIRCKFLFEIHIGKIGSQIEFGHRFWIPKTTKIVPKAMLNEACFATL